MTDVVYVMLAGDGTVLCGHVILVPTLTQHVQHVLILDYVSLVLLH